MTFSIKMELVGLERALRSLDGLSQGLRNRVLRPAVRAGSKLVLDAARRLAPVDSGMLRKSLAVRIQTYRRSGIVMAIVGPRTGYVGRGGSRKRTAFGDKIKETGRNPSKYAHLVEYGHVVVRGGKLGSGGKVVGIAPPRPFLRPAMEQTQQAVIEAMSAKIASELEKLAAKGAL